MNRPPCFAPRSLLLLTGIALTMGAGAASPAVAQFGYGPGFAYPGYGYGGYGPGFAGNGYGYGGYVGPGVAIGGPGFAPGLVGYGPPYGYGGAYGMPGYGPSGIGYANPLFGLGLSPLAVQTTAAERALVRGSAPATRPVTTPPSGTTTRGFPPQSP